jgi:hypothetical protein
MQAAGTGRPRRRASQGKQTTTEENDQMNKIILAIVLTIATLAAVPASAGPYCQEDLGYGRTSSFGCGG